MKAKRDVKKFSLAEKRKALREFRKQAGLSLVELGNMTRLSESSLSRFENGERGLSPAAFNRVLEAITDVLSDKTVEQKVAALRESEAAKKLVPIFPPQNFGRTISLASLDSPETFLAVRSQERIRLLEQLVEGYRRLHETDERIIAMLTERGPGSVAVEATKLLAEVERLRSENKELREWLNAEEVAAVAHDRASELREKVNNLTVAGMRKENAKAESDE